VQTSGFDLILFIIAFSCFLIIFWAYLYSKRLLWFQQDSAKRSESWITTFNARDEASGGWYRRYGRGLLVLLVIILISYPIITNLFAISPFQLFIFEFVFRLPTELILLIILIVKVGRIRKYPLPEKTSPDYNDKSIQGKN
jgi:hypothetical protein